MVRNHFDLSDKALRSLIRKEIIAFGGNKSLRIFGKLNCKSGMRMHKKNRVFFSNMQEAIAEGYRPCGHCMHAEYLKWKDGTN